MTPFFTTPRYISLTSFAVLLLLCGACAAEQSQDAAPAAQVHGNLGQVMRGILFPNSNVIFAAQSKDPTDIKQADDPTLSTDPLTSVYGGWIAVENSAVALAEAANLRTVVRQRPAPARAAAIFREIVGFGDPGIRAGALLRAARSLRKAGAADAALAAYDELARLDATPVDVQGLPAGGPGGSLGQAGAAR